ncbi:MAG: hypothetical protein ACRBB0_13210 [Pelagimonas sp.]|uniref:hypothetical protein n=1 Tax=Pelagimonas sp. TaxID=2073170 RepID=UPI003D6B85C8
MSVLAGGLRLICLGDFTHSVSEGMTHVTLQHVRQVALVQTLSLCIRTGQYAPLVAGVEVIAIHLVPLSTRRNVPPKSLFRPDSLNVCSAKVLLRAKNAMTCFCDLAALIACLARPK